MLGASIDAQVLHLATAERPARNHPLHGLLDDPLRETAFQQLAGRAFLDASRDPRYVLPDFVRAAHCGLQTRATLMPESTACNSSPKATFTFSPVGGS